MRLGMGLHLTRLRAGVAEATALMASATLTRPSAAWAWGSDQLLDEYAADELRRVYDPATGAFRGVLVEESRTNQLLDNRDLSTGNWGQYLGAMVSQDETGIDGSANTAWTVTSSGSDQGEMVFAATTVADDTATHTVKCYLKKGGSTAAQVRARLLGGSVVANNKLLDLTDSSLDSDSGITDAGDWWCLELSVTNDNSGNTTLRFELQPDRDASGQSVVYDYGSMELSTDFASSPIETNGTAITRAPDVLESAFSESSGTLHFVGEHKGGDGVLWQADDTTTGNRLRLEVSGGDVRFVVDDGGANQATLNAGALASDGKYSVAARFDASDFAVSLDGATAVTQGSGTVPTVTTQRFGRDTSATVRLNWYKTANYREALLTDSELEALTA